MLEMVAYLSVYLLGVLVIESEALHTHLPSGCCTTEDSYPLLSFKDKIILDYDPEVSGVGLRPTVVVVVWLGNYTFHLPFFLEPLFKS